MKNAAAAAAAATPKPNRSKRATTSEARHSGRKKTHTLLAVPAPITSSIHDAGLTWSRMGTVFGIACTEFTPNPIAANNCTRMAKAKKFLKVTATKRARRPRVL